MKEKEQSSIEWLFEQLGETGFSHITDSESLIKEAKQLHKKEIIEARDNGIKTNYIKTAENAGFIQSNSMTQNSEQYYTEKYSTE